MRKKTLVRTWFIRDKIFKAHTSYFYVELWARLINEALKRKPDETL